MLLDGPIGTALWLPNEDVAGAALSHPEAVRALHARSVADGAEALLTATFTVPFLLAKAEKKSEAVFWAALDLAAGHAVPIWISLGPPPPSTVAPAIAQTVLTWAAHAAREGRAQGVWLETCRAEDSEWLSAVSDLCARLKMEYVVTFAAHAQAAQRLMQSQAGARAVGLNCGLKLMDDSDADALASARLPLGQKRVFKPAAQLGDARLSPTRLAALARRSHADWAGICCGGTSEHLRALSFLRETQ